MAKIWQNSGTKKALAPYEYATWIFDGRKIAWAPRLVSGGELRFFVNLDEDRQSPGAPVRDSARFHISIRSSAEIHISALQGYLDRKMQFNNSVLEALNFMDHLLRQGPSQRMIAIKRNFYSEEKPPPQKLGSSNVLEVRKGIYASIRMSQNLTQGGVGLALNVEVANTVFWVPGQSMDKLVLNYINMMKRSDLTAQRLAIELRPVQNAKGQWLSSEGFKLLRQLRKLKFKIEHKNRPPSDKLYTAIDFTFDQKFGAAGDCAKTHEFEYNGQQVTVEKYYQLKYKVTIEYPHLPLVNAGRGGFIPMEFAIVEPFQRYGPKLNPALTADMIKIAVQPPPVRCKEIMEGFHSMGLRDDKFMQVYGVKFEPNFTKTEARILSSPSVDFLRGGSCHPKLNGRWSIEGKKFWKPNEVPLVNWGLMFLDNAVNMKELDTFGKSFRQAFSGHGGICDKEGLLLKPPGNVGKDVANAVEWAHNEIIRLRGYTQLLFVVVQQKNSPHYERLKKNADCRFGILSQIVNAQGVRKNAGQFLSNICMKVNAKLGGATSRTKPPWNSTTYFPTDRNTMIIGVDISHGAPGAALPSTAAMTMSMDRDANRYAAVVQTNGYRVEMLTPTNVQSMFTELSQFWKVGHSGELPRHIIYFRDGVGESQFAQVLDQEVQEMKNLLAFRLAKFNKPMPKFTVIVATKRHHIRFFPEKGDRNGNPLPGTLVERDVTHPFMWDFYLASHAAIKGTARPVHYHVLSDEIGMPINDLQKMIYHQCYSYARSTTSISLHPAIYYAHLAGARARAHENIASSEGFRAGAKGHEMLQAQAARETMGGRPHSIDAPPLLPVGGRKPDAGWGEAEKKQREFIRRTMWYI